MCLALGHQLAELVNSGFLKDYLMKKQAGQASGSKPAGSGGQQHEVPIHGEIHTIAGGFSGGGWCTASQRKRYVRSVISVEVFEDHSPDPTWTSRSPRGTLGTLCLTTTTLS